MTYSEAIEQVMLHNGYFAPLKLLYNGKIVNLLKKQFFGIINFLLKYCYKK